MSLPIIPLGELCDMDRQGLSPDDSIASHLPFVGLEHIESESGTFNFDNSSRVGSQKSTSFRFDERHVLYAKLRPYLNKVATPKFAGKCSTELIPLLPRHGVDRDFIAYLLRRKETVEYVMLSVTGARMPRTDMEALMSLPVPLPPLDEQRRIVCILNRATKIKRLRAQAEERLQKFIPALFTKIFGDPVENPMGWNSCILGDLANIVAGDPAPQDPQAFAPEGPLFVRMQDVGHHHRHPALSDSRDHLSAEWVARNRLRLFPKDSILIPKSGASVNLNHRAKLATDAYVVSHLAIVIPDRTKIEPDYLYWWSTNYDPRTQAQVTSLPSLKLATLKSVAVPVPPLEMQRQFVTIIKAVGTTVTLGKENSTNAATLLSSLMSLLLENDA